VKDDQPYLLHILDAVDQAILYASEGRAMFDADRKTREAAIRNLEVIGEAAKTVSAEFRRKHPEVPWKGMTGLRDKIIHQYFGVNYARVWEILTVDLPKLRDQMHSLLAEFPPLLA
jgi:uncharacterized protein with HEPN domain